MKTTISRMFRFEAAHQLPWHPGKCRNLHGHSYRLEVVIEGPIGSDGVIMDFADLRRIVERDVVARYDHRYLNDLIDNPTAELICQDIWKRLEGAGLVLAGIRLWETADCMVEMAPA